MSTVTELRVEVNGRPAPQGSKKQGSAGQMREASPYLPAWRAAVKRAVYEQYQAIGVEASDLPLFRGAVAFGVTFWLDTGQRIDSAPDLDKLLRGVWDALTAARVWEDDGRVIEILWATKSAVREGEQAGAELYVKAAA